MDTHSEKFKIRLGAFITVGLLLFILAVFVIGKQKNLFDPVYKLTACFYNISGLGVGNNVRFSGINVGVVDRIVIINDSTVRVDMLIKKSVKKFIKTDSKALIGSSGLIGDRLLTISQGSTEAQPAKEGQALASAEPVETDAIMASLKVTAGHAEVISDQLAEIMYQVNNGNGILSRLIRDSSMAGNLDETMLNLKKSSKGLNENMEAAKHNFLFKGYFNKLEKDKQKKLREAQEKKAAEKN